MRTEEEIFLKFNPVRFLSLFAPLLGQPGSDCEDFSYVDVDLFAANSIYFDGFAVDKFPNLSRISQFKSV